MANTKTIRIDERLIHKLKSAIDAALEYEAATHGKRKLGITGEVGEILVCYRLGLRLVLDSRSEGFDALDKSSRKIQIKTRRSEGEGLPRTGRTGSFSRHKFDYALLALLDHKYELREVWRTEYMKLKPIMDKQSRRAPNLSAFKSAGRKVL
jgi:hypothetical protein